MKCISTNVNDFHVSFYEGRGKNVEVYVDGELQEDRQYTWFFHALLEEAVRLKKENDKLRKSNKLLFDEISE